VSLEALLAADVPTPALVVDRAALHRNLAAPTLPEGVRLRPHFKAHKCTALIARQLKAVPCAGVTCATAWEAEVVAEALPGTDVLIANEVAEPHALKALARAAPHARVTTCVDSERHLELLEGVDVDVLVEVDVGQRRCGVAPGSGAAVALARRAGSRFRGLQGYEGHAVLLPAESERAGHVRYASDALKAERAELEAAGFTCEIISGGGTGTYRLSAEAGALNEIQAGSYALMDASYAKLGLPFEQALFCRATVVSRHGTRVVFDAGLKALSAEYGMPGAAGELTVVSLADEHAVATVPEDSPLRVGDPALLIPAHVDPTVNLHPWLQVVDDSGAVEAWAVDGRRR
jgi:D-threonine aldolase